MKNKRQKGGLNVHCDPLRHSCNPFKQPVFQFHLPLFLIPSSSLKLVPSPLDFLLSFCPPPPLSDSSITSVWLPVGSSHCEMYECREKWMANSIKSIIPEAPQCYQQHCKGVLMHCLHAQPRPLPTPTEIKVVVVRVCENVCVCVHVGRKWRGASQSHQRLERACFSSRVTHSSGPFTFTTRKLLSLR